MTEPTVYELSAPGRCGLDLPACDVPEAPLPEALVRADNGLPELSQLDVVRHILDVHRPAHTLFDICTVESGMRVGVALYVELNSIVGRSGGFSAARVGQLPLGAASVLGSPQAGTRPGGSRLGMDSRIG